MPQFIAAAQAAISALGFWGLTGMQVISISLAIYGVVSAQAAARRARREYNASLQDRHVMLQAADAPRKMVYGRGRISGPIADGFSSGAKSEFFHIPLALVGHEIDAVEDIWLGDESVGTLDGSGYVAGGAFYKSSTAPETHKAPVPASPYQITTPLVPTAVESVVVPDPAAWWDSESQFTVLVEGVDYTRAGAVFTFLAAHTGKAVTITYTATSAGAFVRILPHLGTSSQAADADMIAASDGKWTAAHQGKGVAYLYVRLEYNQDIFPMGLPNISAVVRGKKVYDPRTTLTVWSTNPALCARDFITDPIYGLGAAASEIDDASVIAAANICDELIPIDGGTGTQSRYTCNGVLSSEADPRENLKAIVSSMAGVARYVGGYWALRAGAYTIPVDTLTEDDLADGTIGIVARSPRRELFNAVRGRFVDPANLYALHDYPLYASSVYAAEDAGEVIYQDLDLPMTNDATMAQRIAKLALHQARQPLTVEATWKLSAYKYGAGDTIMLTLERYGFLSKPFRVIDRDLMPEGRIKLVLREEAQASYAWNYTEAAGVDPAPNTVLPDVRIVPSLGALTVASGAAIFKELSDGTVVPEVKVSWAAVTDSGVLQGGYIEFWFKRAIATDWNQVSLDPAMTSYRFAASVSETVNISARCINGAGVRGAWSFATHGVDAGTPSGLPVATWDSITGTGKPSNNATASELLSDYAASGTLSTGALPADGYVNLLTINYTNNEATDVTLAVSGGVSAAINFASFTTPSYGLLQIAPAFATKTPLIYADQRFAEVSAAGSIFSSAAVMDRCVLAPTESITIVLRLRQNNWTGSNYAGGSWSNAILRVEVIK